LGFVYLLVVPKYLIECLNPDCGVCFDFIVGMKVHSFVDYYCITLHG